MWLSPFGDYDILCDQLPDTQRAMNSPGQSFCSRRSNKDDAGGERTTPHDGVVLCSITFLCCTWCWVLGWYNSFVTKKNFHRILFLKYSLFFFFFSSLQLLWHWIKLKHAWAHAWVTGYSSSLFPFLCIIIFQSTLHHFQARSLSPLSNISL